MNRRDRLLILTGAGILLVNCYYNGILCSVTGSFCKETLESSEIPTFETIKRLPINHPLLLRYLKENHLQPPSKLPYPQDILKGDPSEFKDLIAEIFKEKKGGFFIECGANDGHFRSNTWVLERDFGWSGLLIEANPEMNKKLVTRNRKAWFADICLSPHNNLSEIEFLVSAKHDYQWEQGIGKVAMKDDILYSKIDKNRTKFKFQTNGNVECFPILSIMLAINVNYVDYFSLDVQGIEAKIMKTFPFDDRLIIDVFQVEYELDPEGKEWMRSFMESKGYKVIYEGHVNYVFKRITNDK